MMGYKKHGQIGQKLRKTILEGFRHSELVIVPPVLDAMARSHGIDVPIDAQVRAIVLLPCGKALPEPSMAIWEFMAQPAEVFNSVAVPHAPMVYRAA